MAQQLVFTDGETPAVGAPVARRIAVSGVGPGAGDRLLIPFISTSSGPGMMSPRSVLTAIQARPTNWFR